MCFSAPKPPKPMAQPAPPASAGADSLILGPTSNNDDQLRNSGLLGRLALRIGRGGGTNPSAAPGAGQGDAGNVGAGTGGAAGGGTGSVGSGTGGTGPVGGGGGGSGGGSLRVGSSKA